MAKKALKVAATIGVLLAGYAGYVRGFVILAARLDVRHGGLDVAEAVPRGPREESRTTREAYRLARESFGEGHWSADRSRSNIQFIDTQKGYWFYAGSYKREGDGRRIAFTPFAVISRSRDGRTSKTITGKEAILDFDKPFNLGKPGGQASHVVHALVNDEVVIRDNKGTPNLADDLIIGPLRYLEFDEADLQIRTKAPVHLKDRDLDLTGVGLQLDLRPAEGGARAGGSGFDGAKTAWLTRDIRLHVDDVGKSGILPGASQSGPAGAKTPLDLACDGPMRIDLPEPPAPVRVGPPAPGGPTLAHFERNVNVLRGAVRPDQLTCDTLLLTLVPAPKPAAAVAPAPPANAPEGGEAGAGGPLSDLALRRADADGHAVFLRSEAQGLKTRGNQLIYKKLLPEKPDEIYLRAERGAKLRLEKVDLVAAGKDKGKVQSVTDLEAIDATIFQDGSNAGGGGPGRVVARGPGWLETRPARDRPIERRATWQDELIMETKSQDVEPHRLVYLVGSPTMNSPTQGDLRARDKIILCLVPAPKPAPGAPVGDNAPESVAQGHQIKWLQARNDVDMVSADPAATPAVADGVPAPASKRTMHARDWLFVRFDPPPAPAPAPAVAVGVAPAPSVVGEAPAESPAADSPSPAAEAVAATPAGPPPGVAAEPGAIVEARPAEPNMDVRANQVWARVALGNGPNKGEVREVRLRGDVFLHQDAAPGKARGTDVTGDKVDLTSEAPGRAIVLAHGRDDVAAKAVTEGSEIEGPILGLDQAKDFAWVAGAGRLKQMAARDLTGTPAAAGEKAEAKALAKDAPGAEAPPKRPVVITWDERMEFFGRTTDDRGRPGPARAHFFGNVLATVIDEAEDSRIACHQEMIANLDRPVRFVQPAKDPKAAAEEPEPKPQLVALRALKGVAVQSRKTDPKTRAFVQLQRIDGEDVTYEKLSGNFWVDGAGYVRLYDVADKPAGAPGATPPLSSTEGAPSRGARILRVAAKRSAPRAPAPPAVAPPVAAAGTRPRPPAATRPPRPAPRRDPLMLTQILFHDRMEGRFAGDSAGNPTPNGPRDSQFFGGVEVLRARVGSEDAALDSDRPPPDLMTLSSRTLNVESLPPPPKSQAKVRNLLRADGDATVTNQGNTIQGDYTTYDSLTELAATYGLNGNPVSFTKQDAPGQSFSANSGKAYLYNLKTGQGEVVEPSQILLLDAKTGVRLVPFPSLDGLPKKPVKPNRVKPLLPSRGDKERKGFMGR